MNSLKRYNPFMVILHWLTVIFMLGAGLLAEDGGRSPINLHMILGSLLLVTILVRVIVRFTSERPPRASTGNKWLDMLAEWVHIGLYFFAFYILAFGAVIASKRNLIGYVLGNGSVSRLQGADNFMGGLHHLGFIAVMGLLLLHVGGALYHQFIIKDNLLSRMWFGK